MDNKKNQVMSLVWTGGIHFFIMLFLLFTYLKPTISGTDNNSLGGIPIMFGNVLEAGGDNEAFGLGGETLGDEISPIPNDKDITSTDLESNTLLADDNIIITQDSEETTDANIETVKEQEVKKEQENIATEEQHRKEEAERIAREQAAAGKRVESQIAGLFGNGDENGNHGNSQGAGNQGVETGNASFGEKNAVAGVGGGFKLGNRKLGPNGLIRPKYDVNAEGIVVIAIRVDFKGKVINATVAQGTTTSDATLLKEALKAAEKTQFNEIEINKDELGTITYTFTLN